MFPADIEAVASRIVAEASRQGLWLTTAESCTGGLVAGALTGVAGSSAIFDRGFVTYSNVAKTALLGVPPELLDTHGAVSQPVARAMARGALRAAGADLAVAVTGIAGPGGGSADKPVGLVHFGLALPNGEIEHTEKRFGDLGRQEIRLESVRIALGLLAEGLHQRD